jgi:putative FmdB family regulatory protein
MPIYAYRCEACGHAKDVLQKFSDPLLTTCPSCGAEAFKKQVTAAGFQLKGSGWYVTDFRGDSKAGKPAGDGTAVLPPKDGVDAAKGDAGKADTSKADTGKSDAGKSDAAKSDAGTKPATAAAPAAAPATGSGSTPSGQ